MTLDPVLFDHLLALVLMGVLPLRGVHAWKRLSEALARGEPDARIRAYRRALLTLWGLTGVLVAGWVTLGRSAEALGLAAPSGLLSWSVLGGAGLLAAFQLGQVRALREHPEMLSGVREQLTHLRPLLPTEPRELRWFYGVGITAGITEELLFRGFLLSYLATFLGVWPAVFLSSVAFGMGHLYQGGAGSVLKTGTIGLVLGTLYVLSGQLWASILLHAVIDLASGWAAYQALRVEPATSEVPGAGAD